MKLSTLVAALAAALTVPTIDVGLHALADEPADARGMAVRIVKARNDCFIDTLKASGHIVAREEVFVKPEVEGLQIARLLAEDGATVGEGEPLAQLVRPDWMPGTPAKATLSAPVAGILVYRHLAVGMTVSPRGDPLFRIIRDGEMDLLVDIPLSAMAKIKPGQSARITLLDETELAGTVRVILPEIDPQTQLGHARVTLRARHDTRPGAFASAAIDLGRSCGPAIPLSAVLYGPQGAIVQVVRNDRVETRRVKVGLFENADVEILEGLSAGDAVVARAGAFLREGDPVRPMP